MEIKSSFIFKLPCGMFNLKNPAIEQKKYTPFGCLDFSASFQPLSAPKKWSFGRVSAFLSCLEFVSLVENFYHYSSF